MDALSDSAMIALDNYDYSGSIKYSLELINEASDRENHYYLYHGYNFLGITYEILEETERAEESYLKSLEHALAAKNDTLVWWAYNNLGNIYTVREDQVQKGLDYYKKAIEIVNRLKDFESGIDPILNIGWTYIDEGKYEKALPYLDKVQRVTKDYVNYPILKSQLKTLFGRYYAGTGDFDRAKDYFEEAIQITEKDSLVLGASDAYSEYAKLLFENEHPAEAYLALKKHLEFQEEIYEKEKLHQMEAAYSRFQTQRYREDLAVAQREQKYKDEVIAKSRQVSTIFIVFSILLLLVLILLFINNNSRKRLIKELQEKNTELELAKEKAERLSMLKSKFFSTVSHELRTPLYGVVGLTSLLLEDNKNKEKEEDLKSLKFSADYLLALINDVLHLNKMDLNLMELEDISFNIDELLNGIIKSFEFTRHQNQNTIDLHIDEKIPKNLIGDSLRLSQILMNLVGNAVKFTERGRVWVMVQSRKCDKDKCLIYFEVGDTGSGIPKNKQKEIFEEFSQLRSNNYNYQGTGLGLPIVKKLLQLFDSEIKLESNEGEGSIFSFEISFRIGTENLKDGLPAEATAIGGLAENNISTKKVLIVDDNRINQIVTERILRKKDFHCEIAGSGEIAVQILKKEKFDLVLMDINMPGMNGMETTREIRSFNKGIPVIALTAVELDEMRDEILKSGMNDIIVKPYDIPKFFHTIFRNLLITVE